MTRTTLKDFEARDTSFKKMLSRQAHDFADLNFTVVAIVSEPTTRTPFKWGWTGQGETITTNHKILLLTNSRYGNPKVSFVMRHTIQDRRSNDPRDQYLAGAEETAACWPTTPEFAELIKYRERARREARSSQTEKENGRTFSS